MIDEWSVRELDEMVEVRRAAEDVRAWGFPRPVEEQEIEFGFWFRMGRTVVWWYEPPHPVRPMAALIHLAVAPRVRGLWPVRKWVYAARICAELMGANELLFAVDEKDGQIVQYARRVGFVEDGPRWRLPLGGGS